MATILEPDPEPLRVSGDTGLEQPTHPETTLSSPGT